VYLEVFGVKMRRKPTPGTSAVANLKRTGDSFSMLDIRKRGTPGIFSQERK